MSRPLSINLHEPSLLLDGVAGLVFDCDGVLFDSFESNKVYYNAIRSRLGLAPMSPEDEMYVHSRSVEESLARIIPPGRRADGEIARKDVDYFKEILPLLTPAEGLLDCVEIIRGQGFKTGIATNRTTSMIPLAQKFGLDGVFDPIFTALIAPPKPDPTCLFRTAEIWGVDLDDIIFIGDSAVDEATAQAAGVRFWVFGEADLAAELRIPDFFALSRFFQKTGQRPQR